MPGLIMGELHYLCLQGWCHQSAKVVPTRDNNILRIEVIFFRTACVENRLSKSDTLAFLMWLL